MTNIVRIQAGIVLGILEKVWLKTVLKTFKSGNKFS